MLERDPGVGFPVWTHGPASQFVVAQRFMEARAKAAGVFDLWTGVEKTEFAYPKPKLSLILDTEYADARVLEDSEDGRSMLLSSRVSRNSPASAIRGARTTQETEIFRSPGGLILLQDPQYNPAEDEKDVYSGLEFARLVQRTNNFDKYNHAVGKTREHSMK